ncbi:MAG TPA: DNA mismatch repair protein MutS [Thermodesulfatator sp.]|nr:DNA mismatch repair protein MutS [Thermodesulfatator sp.]
MSEKKPLFSPFSALKDLVDKDSLPSLDRLLPEPARDEAEDEACFKAAMAGVKPLSGHRRIVGWPFGSSLALKRKDDSCKELNLSDVSLRVEDLPEYIEELVCGTNPLILTYLREGLVSPQRHLDLHGLSVDQAQAALETFLRESVAAGCHCILIIHGRGLSSPRGPVLKGLVQRWLSRSFWRRYVVAFASAPPYDGGPGATYVLLRQRPAGKKHRRRRRR